MLRGATTPRGRQVGVAEMAPAAKTYRFGNDGRSQSARRDITIAPGTVHSSPQFGRQIALLEDGTVPFTAPRRRARRQRFNSISLAQNGIYLSANTGQERGVTESSLLLRFATMPARYSRVHTMLYAEGGEEKNTRALCKTKIMGVPLGQCLVRTANISITTTIAPTT